MSVVVEAGDDAFYVPVPAVLPLLAFGLALAGASEPAHLRRTCR